MSNKLPFKTSQSSQTQRPHSPPSHSKISSSQGGTIDDQPTQHKGPTKQSTLTWWDLIVLTALMFGSFIYSSWLGFMALDSSLHGEMVTFSSTENWRNLWYQAVLLALALVYLHWRRFDFSVWPMRLSWRAVAQGLGLYLLIALCLDLAYIIPQFFFPYDSVAVGTSTTQHVPAWPQIDLSLLLYAAFNGVYEELFFLGMCLAVATKKRYLVLLFSVAVRYAFHTYQGQLAALTIGVLMGGLFYVMYTRMRHPNLVPFFIAHAIGDVIGVGILGYLWYLF